MEMNFSPVEEEDLHTLHKWFNDSELTKNFYNDLPVNTLHIKKIITCEMNEKYPLFFLQYVDNHPIGFFRLHDLDFVNRKVEITLAIAEKNYRSKGFGKKLLDKALSYSFYDLNLEQVFLYVYKNNFRATSLYTKFGFKTEGEFRLLKYYLGKPVPGYRMSLFQNEYRSFKTTNKL